jgi:peptidoglycan-associated lipoprotein
VRIRAIGVLAVGILLACQSGGPTTTERPERPLREEPGLPETPGTTGAVEPRAGQLRTIYFDFDDATLRSDAKDALRQNGDLLRSRSGTRIEVQGHCDERGSEEYNLALGQRRAESAKRYLMDLGIRASRVETKTFGESMPAVRGHDESAWAKNRRDEFVILR